MQDVCINVCIMELRWLYLRCWKKVLYTVELPLTDTYH